MVCLGTKGAPVICVSSPATDSVQGVKNGHELTKASQYPKDYRPPNKGKCEWCGAETKGWTLKWLSRCPKCWQELVK